MRHYLIGTWSGADEYDYSGEQLLGGRTPGRSTCVDHVLPDGRANLARYADIPKGKTPKTKQELVHDLLYSINPDEKKLDILDEKEQSLTNAYIAGLISDDQYEKALETLFRKRYAVHKKMARETCEDMQQWTEEHGIYEDKKKLYNSKNYVPSLATQARLLSSIAPKESKLQKIVKWLINN